MYEETKIREKETGGAELKAMMSKHHINKRGPKCFNCGKNGHMKCDCRLLGEEFKEGLKRNYQKKIAFFTDKMPANFSHSKNDHIVGLFAHHALLTNNERNSWIVDFGVTCHMCPDVNKLINFTKLDVAEDISQGDGHSVEVLGIRIVELK